MPGLGYSEPGAPGAKDEMADTYSKDEMNRRMNGAVATLKSELGGLRTGRASAALLDPVKVEAYGNTVPINQVGTISTPEARMITVQVWDKGLAKAVDKAIRDAGLGLNPADGRPACCAFRCRN